MHNFWKIIKKNLFALKNNGDFYIFFEVNKKNLANFKVFGSRLLLGLGQQDLHQNSAENLSFPSAKEFFKTKQYLLRSDRFENFSFYLQFFIKDNNQFIGMFIHWRKSPLEYSVVPNICEYFRSWKYSAKLVF